MEPYDLCQSLINCESEEEVLELLVQEGLWDDSNAWKPYGGMENNYSIVNGQQETAEAALAELLVNAADANLLKECRIEGIDPTDLNSAPKDINDVLSRYYNLGPSRFVDLAVNKRAQLGDNASFICYWFKEKCRVTEFMIKGRSLPEHLVDTFLAKLKQQGSNSFRPRKI